MTLETVITIQMISAGICTGVCLVVLIGAALDAIMSKKPGKYRSRKRRRRAATTSSSAHALTACIIAFQHTTFDAA